MITVNLNIYGREDVIKNCNCNIIRNFLNIKKYIFKYRKKKEGICIFPHNIINTIFIYYSIILGSFLFVLISINEALIEKLIEKIIIKI